jgi:putative RNA 2'-phosphotransferase
MSNNIKHISKLMSLVLRHQPEVIGIELDKNGWAPVDALMEGIQRKGIALSRELLNEVVETNDKKRFLFNEDGTKIRANQGHSLKVDVELKAAAPPEILYHGTVFRFLDAIRAEGLKPMSRQHVHLSKELSTAQQVGGRRGKPIILKVKAGAMHAAGTAFYLSENGVWLTAAVPPEYIEFGS